MDGAKPEIIKIAWLNRLLSTALLNSVTVAALPPTREQQCPSRNMRYNLDSDY